MKKNYLITLLLTLCINSISFGQEMITNGGLEDWTDTTTLNDWSKTEALTQSSDAHSGSFSAFRNGGSGTKDLSQTITGIVPGESYTISFWYKVTSGDDDDARIWCAWKNGSTTVYHTSNATTDILRGPENGYLDNNGGVWTKHEVTVTAPAGVNGFNYEVRSYSGSVTYWDDLSFVKNATASLSKNTITGFATYPNPVIDNKLTITSASSTSKNVSIYNLLGKKVFVSNFSGLKKEVDVSSLNTGMYILKVTEESKIATKKIVIK